MDKYNKMNITFINMHNISNHVIYRFFGQKPLTFCKKFIIPQKIRITLICMLNLDFCAIPQKLHKALNLEHNNPINHIYSQDISILQFLHIFLHFSPIFLSKIVNKYILNYFLKSFSTTIYNILINSKAKSRT